MRAWLAILLLMPLSGCARWAYSPTWKGFDRRDDVELRFETQGAVCGELRVRNGTGEALTVVWKDVRTVLPDGTRTPTRLRAAKGESAPERSVLKPRAVQSVQLCTRHSSFIVRARPPTGWDFALGWFFGSGVLAGNIKWRPSKDKQRRVVRAPRAFGWDLIVPVEDASGRRPLTLPVRGEGVTAFKYTKRVHGKPRKLQRP
jgi:hypothetical protein